jgi:hypothetical protein
MVDGNGGEGGGGAQLAIGTYANAQVVSGAPVGEAGQILIHWLELAGAPPATPGPPMTYEIPLVLGLQPLGG